MILILSGGDNVTSVNFKSVSQQQILTFNYPNITLNGDPNTEQRLSDLEESTDGLVNNVDPLTYYILARDN